MAQTERQQDAADTMSGLDPPGRDGFRAGRVFCFDLPCPPLLNHYYRSRGYRAKADGKVRSMTYLSREAVEYRETVDRQIPPDDAYPLNCRLAIDIQMYWATKRAWDIDNPLKGLLDALTHAGIVEDDSQFDALRIVRGPVRRGGRCLVTITELISEVRQGRLYQ